MEPTPKKKMSSLQDEPNGAGSVAPAPFGEVGDGRIRATANEPGGGTPLEQSPVVTASPSGSPVTSTNDASLSIELASISDAPTADDELGFKPYVTAIAKFLLSDQTRGPLTLSIEGEWGSGKSSFMKQLEKVLAAPSPELLVQGQRPPATRTFWFNAWRQDKQEAVWAAFALAFGRELRAKNVHKWRSGLRFAFQRARSNPDHSGLASASIKAIAWIAGIVFCFATLHSLGPNWLKWFLSGTVTLAALVQGYKGMEKVVGNPFETHVSQYLRGPDYAQRVAFIEQFHDDFQRMLDTYAQGVHKIFVLIDDVDRCEVPKAAELMQAFNLLIGEDERLVFIIGMDREKVAAGIAAKYKDLAPFLYGNDATSRVDYGFSYLEKFIQLPFQIPPPNIDLLDKFFEKMSIQPTTAQMATTAPGNSGAIAATAKVATGPTPAPLPASPTQQKVERDLEFTGDSARVRAVAKMFASTVQRSPRRLKQFINLFRLKAHIANQLTLFDDDHNAKQKLTFEQLGKFVAISLTWPKLIGELCANPLLLAHLENVALAALAPTSSMTEGVAKSSTAAATSIAKMVADPTRLTALLQYGCVEKPGWPFESTLYSFQSVDLLPMLEISPQIVREPRRIGKTSPPAAPATEKVETATSALGQVGPKPIGAVPALIEALRDPDSEVRRGAAGALGQVGPEAIGAVPALIEALRDPDSEVRRGAAGALGQVGPKPIGAVPALIEALRDPDSEVRRGAAGALGQVGPEAIDAVPALIAALRDPDSEVRRGTAGALGQVGSETIDAIPALIAALRDPDGDVRNAAAEAIRRIDPDFRLDLIGLSKQ